MSTPASRLDRYRRIAGRARKIAGEHGLRPHRVCVVAARTGGTYTGDGGRWEISNEILEQGFPPKIRWLKNDELALGTLPDGTVDIGPITPTNTSGGTALKLFDGSTLEVGAVRLLRIVGPQHPNGADYRVMSTGADRAIHYTIRACPVGAQR